MTVNFTTVQCCCPASLICGDRCSQLVLPEFASWSLKATSLPLQPFSPPPSLPLLGFSMSWSTQPLDLAFCDHPVPRRIDWTVTQILIEPFGKWRPLSFGRPVLAWRSRHLDVVNIPQAPHSTKCLPGLYSNGPVSTTLACMSHDSCHALEAS